MKIAVVQSFLPGSSNGGVGHFAHQLANTLADRNHEVTMFSLDPAPPGARYRVIRPADASWLYRGRLSRLFGFGLWLAQQSYAEFDVVHAMGDNHLLRTSTPVVRTLHGSARAEAAHATRWRTRLMFAALYPLELVGALRADVAVAVSGSTCQDYPRVAEVIPNGVDTDMFHPGDHKSDSPTVLFVGHSLHDRKRADLLLRAFTQSVRRRFPDAELWLVCDAPVSAPGVRSFSNLGNAELATLYRDAWVFCLPSSYEGFGRPYAEALASGTPVVSTNNAGALEVLQYGQFGVIARPAELGAQLVRLLENERERKRLADLGLTRAPNFAWPTVASRYESVYASVAVRRQRPLRAQPGLARQTLRLAFRAAYPFWLTFLHVDRRLGHAVSIRQMKRDWNARAREHSRHFIALAADASEEEFRRSGDDEVRNLIESRLDILVPRCPAAEAEVLEIGCGTGRMTRPMSRLFGRVVALDVSEEMIRQASARLRDLANVRLLVGNGVDLRELSDGSFDLVVSFLVFQHIPDAAIIKNYIAEAARVLRRGGTFFFQVRAPVEYERHLLHRPKDTWIGAVLTQGEVERALARCGLVVTECWGQATSSLWIIARRPWG